MASAEEQHNAFADSLEEEVDRPLREILERKKFKDIQRNISTSKQMSSILGKRIRTYENVKHVLRRDFNLPSTATECSPKSMTSRERSIFSPLEDLLTQSSFKTPVDAAISCVGAWNDVEQYREEHETYVEGVARETYDMASIHYESCKDGLRKYVVFLLNMLANSQFDARKLIHSVESIDVAVDMKISEKEREPSELNRSQRELKSPCGEIHFLATSETEEKSQKRRNSTDIRTIFKSAANSLSEQLKNLSPSSSSKKLSEIYAAATTTTTTTTTTTKASVTVKDDDDLFNDKKDEIDAD